MIWVRVLRNAGRVVVPAHGNVAAVQALPAPRYFGDTAALRETHLCVLLRGAALPEAAGYWQAAFRAGLDAAGYSPALVFPGVL
jgi:uncharacterized protein with von Willebrand factor type A (vWA) domain